MGYQRCADVWADQGLPLSEARGNASGSPDSCPSELWAHCEVDLNKNVLYLL